jgi:protein phosphatase
VRDENQDAVFIAGDIKSGDMNSCEISEITSHPLCFAVIDGMGGHEGGAMAARILAETFAGSCNGENFGRKFDLAKDERVIKEILKEASERMSFEARKNPSLSEMGAAVAGLLIRDNTAAAFNCGDCRAYRLCGGDIERLTRDHSVVQTLFEMGNIHEDEMRTHPRKNIVTSAVTANSANEPILYIRGISRIDDDEYFLCSDGVWETISSDAINGYLCGPFPDSAGVLLNALITAECRDNISFIWLVSTNSDAQPQLSPRSDRFLELI